MTRTPKKTMTALTLAAFLATSITPAMAASFDGMPDMRYNPYGAHAQTRGTTAGAYIRIPFKGGLRRPTEEARVGFALSTRLSGQYHDPGRFAAVGTPRLIDLSFGLSGQRPIGESFRFNGMSLHQVNALYADEEGEDGEKKKGGSGWWVLGGLLIVGVGVTALVAAKKFENLCFFGDPDGRGGCE